MKLIIKLLYVGIIYTQSLGAQSFTPDREQFGVVCEKFYTNLGSGNLDVIESFAVPINKNRNNLYGKALRRNPAGLIDTTSITTIANSQNFKSAFKRWVGCEVISYSFIAVRYMFPPDFEEYKSTKNLPVKSKWFSNEKVHCDLWLLGSDKKWRVACDYFPGVELDCQSLGLAFATTSKEAEELQQKISED